MGCQSQNRTKRVCIQGSRDLVAQRTVSEPKYNEEGVHTRKGNRQGGMPKPKQNEVLVGGCPTMGSWLHAGGSTKQSKYIKNDGSQFSH